MEENLSDALLEAGQRLAEALRLGLSAHGLPTDLQVLLDGNKVVVASQSAALRIAEVGRPGCPPKAILEGLARDAVPDVLQAFADRFGSNTP